MSLSFTANADRVNLGSGSTIDGLTTFSVLMWCYPTAQSDPSRLWSKGDPGKRVNWRASDTNELVFVVNRATVTAATTTLGENFPTNTWIYFAFTWDAADRARIFHGRLGSIAVEATYDGTWDAVGSGTVVDDSGNNLYIGNESTNAFADVSNFDGRIANFHYIAERLTLEQIRAQQFRPHVISTSRAFFHLGFNGTGTQPDLSGNGNNGTVTGATVADHVPLGSPFGFVHTVPYVVPTAVNVNLSAATLASSGPAIDPTPGAVSKALQNGVLASSGPAITVQGVSSINVNLQPANLVSQGLDLYIRHRPYYVSSLETDFSATASPVVTAPSGIVDGDFLVMFLVTSTSTNTATPIAGWARAGTEVDDGADYTTSVYTKVASGEGASWTLTNIFNSSESGRAVVLVYRGVGPMGLVAVDQNVQTTGTTVSGPSITPAYDGCMIIQMLGTDPGAGAYSGTPDASPVATERFDGKDGGNLAYVYIQEYYQATAAAIALDATGLVSDSYGYHQIALAPFVSAGFVSLNPASLSSSGPAITVTAQAPSANVNLSSAQAVSSGQALTVVPGAVSKALQNALLSSSGPQLDVVTVTNLALQAATGALSGPSLAVVPGAISKALQNALLQASGPAIAPTPGAVSKALQNGLLASSGPQLTVGSVSSIALAAALLAGSGPQIDVVPGAVSKALQSALLASSGPSVTIIPGAISRALQSAILASSGPLLDVVPGAVSKALNAAQISMLGQAITIALGGSPVNVALNPATITSVGPSTSITPGAVSRSLQNAILSSSGLAIGVLPGARSISLASALLQTQNLSIGVLPGAVSISLSVGTLVIAGQTLVFVTAIGIMHWSLNDRSTAWTLKTRALLWTLQNRSITWTVRRRD